MTFFLDLVSHTDEARRAFQHMQEELGHEDWVLNDLAAVGESALVNFHHFTPMVDAV